MAHRVRNENKVFPEFAGNVLIDRIRLGQFQRDCQQIERVHGHPTGPVGLFDISARRQRSAAIEDANIVEPQESTLENVHPPGIFTVHPPREIQYQLMEDTLQKVRVAFSRAFLVDLVNAPRRPRMHRRIHVSHGPLVSGNLSVGMQVPFAQDQCQLVLSKIRIHQRQRNAVKRQVPCRIPRVFPFVGH